MKNRNRMYKNELLQESYQNKLGLVNKPSMSQLMIGDFIREQSQKVTKLRSLGRMKDFKCYNLNNSHIPDINNEAKRIKTNISDAKIIQSKYNEILTRQLDTKIKRRYTSKSGKKNEEYLLSLNDTDVELSYLKSEAALRKRIKNSSKAILSKIKLRNPSHLRENEEIQRNVLRRLMKFKNKNNRRNKSQEEISDEDDYIGDYNPHVEEENELKTHCTSTKVKDYSICSTNISIYPTSQSINSGQYDVKKNSSAYERHNSILKCRKVINKSKKGQNHCSKAKVS